MTPKSVKPVVVASGNGNTSKDADNVTCVAKAFGMITKGSDVLDALVAGVTIVELDPNQTGVGWSGLPNADGVVQLDACCMHGPKKQAGGVAGIEGVRAPARVAQLVSEETDHHLLVGKGAQDFARAMGIKIEEGLINDKARGLWLEWKRRTDPLHYLDPKKRAQAWNDAGLQMVREGLISADTFWGTINCDGDQPERRDLRRDDDERPGVEDPGPRGRLADSRRRALRRRRGRRRRFDGPRRSQSLQPVVVPDRRGDAPGRAPEGRGDDGAAPRGEEHDREAAAQREGHAELRTQLLLS